LLGNSTYAFTLMLTAFLSGIALGGFLIRFIVDRARSPIILFAWLEILIGGVATAVLPLLFTVSYSETVRGFLARTAGQFGSLMLSRFGTSLLVMLIPATLIGATFPLVGRLCVSDLRRTGQEVGTVYAVNTVGNVAGALLPAFLILPLLGIQKGVVLMGALNIGVGGVVLLSRWRRLPGLRTVAVITVAVVAILLTRLPLDFQFPSEQQTERHRVLYYRDGPLGTTKVFLDPETQERLMSVDGVVIGGSGVTDYKQQLLAHLPKLLLKEYETELTVGLGSAILAGESARHPGLKRIVCVEIEPTVVEGAAHFKEESYAVLDDPRVEVIVDDVANYLRTTSERFDIVSADEKTAENYASNGFSYSRDYYDLLRDHLTPRGVVVQWMTSLPASQYTMVLKTFTNAFPHASIWYFTPVGNRGPTNVILVGSLEAIALDQAWMNEVLERRADDFSGLRKYGLINAESVLAHYVAGGDTVRNAVRDARENSLERPYFEFYSPREYAVSGDERTLRMHDFLTSIREPDIPNLVADGVSEAAARRLRDAVAAEREFLAGFRRQLRNEPLPDVTAHFERALEMASWNENLRYQILLYYWNTAGNSYLRGDYPRALRFMRKAVETYVKNGEVFYYLGLTLLQTGQSAEAIEALQTAISLDPKLVSARHRLASYYLNGRQTEQAAEQLRAILAIDSENLFALLSYGMQLASGDERYDEALDYLRRAYRLAPDDPAVIDGYAWASYLSGDRVAARRIVIEGGEYYAGYPQLERRRGTIITSQP
jgi:spermidine synthase